MSSKNVITTLRERIAARKAEQHERQVLEHELANYTSRTELLELELILDRYPDETTAPVRDILARQQFIAA